MLWNAGWNFKAMEAWVHRYARPGHQETVAVIPKPPNVASVRKMPPVGRMGTDSSASTIPLHMVLVRTILGQNVHSGQALLGVDRDHPQTYLAGAFLENGLKVDEIYGDHVVLTKGRQRTTLFVDSIAPSREASAGAAAYVLVGGPTPNVEAPHLSVEPVTDYLRPVPVYQDGLITGFQVYPGARPGIFAKWGLQPGDVITDLDGQPLSDPDQTMELLRSLEDGEALTATVRRGSAEPIQVSLDGAAIVQMRTASNTPPVAPPMP